MRAWRVHQFGKPTDVLRLDETMPDFAPGPGELKVRVQAAGLGLPDVFMCANRYPLTPPLPFTPAQEAAGTIVAVGDGVDKALVGSRVMGPTVFWAQRGGLAEECLMLASGALPIPDDMPAVEAAGFYIPYLTAWVGLVRRAAIGARDTVLVLGASGSSGSAAVQLAKAKGAYVIAVAGGPQKVEFCRSLGADAVIDHQAQDITEVTLELTDGKGASVIYDPVGGKAGQAAFKATAFEGRFLVIGYASGEWPNIVVSETLAKNVSLMGVMPAGFARELMVEAHEELIAHWRSGSLSTSCMAVFEFEEAPRAIEHIAERRVEGKVVVRVANQ